MTTLTTEQEKVLSRVRDMLTLAENEGATPEEADLTAVDVLYTSLLLQAQSQLQRAKVPYYDNTKSFRVSWWIGFIEIIIGRLQAAYAKAKEDSTDVPGTAIVLRDRALEVQAKFRADHARTKKVQGSDVTSMSGFRGGQETARNVNIHNRPDVGQRQRTAIG